MGYYKQRIWKKLKKGSEIQTVKVEGKKITDQQIVAETFNEYYVAITENVKDKVKIILLMMITIIWIVIPISWNKLLIIFTKVWNAKAKQQKKLNEL